MAMNMQLIYCLISVLVSLPLMLSGQQVDIDSAEQYSPYDLLSSYYNEDFKPFAKKNVYLGLSFSLEDRTLTNTTNLLETIIDGDRLNYDVTLKGGYYTGNYGMVGINFNYFQNKFVGDVFRDPDTLQSNTINRGFALTPFFRSSVPLTSNERFSFFTDLGITFGYSNSLRRDIKNLDEVDKLYSSNFNFRVGLSPGLTFFVMENFAFEVQLNVLGYELQVRDQTANDEDSSREIRQNVDFNIDLLSLQFGLAYYFGAKN